MLTVKQLIEHLQTMPPDTVVAEISDKGEVYELELTDFTLESFTIVKEATEYERAKARTYYLN